MDVHLFMDSQDQQISRIYSKIILVQLDHLNLGLIFGLVFVLVG